MAMGAYENLMTKQKEFANEPIIPQPLINGHDLMNRGVTPGPRIGAILRDVQDLQLEGIIKERNTALQWLDDHLDKGEIIPDQQQK